MSPDEWAAQRLVEIQRRLDQENAQARARWAERMAAASSTRGRLQLDARAAKIAS